jgi:DNA-binding GntR family transcriptional regulator
MPVTPEYRPDYQRVIDYVTERITSGEWPGGFKVPPPDELATAVDPPTSAATVRRATDTLKDRGVLYGRQGKGVFVTPPATPGE